MNIQPLGKRVLLLRKESETKTKTGLYIPDTAQEKTQEGEVVAIGTKEDTPLKVGDKVLFEKYGGTEFEFDSKKYVVMKIKDILAIVR